MRELVQLFEKAGVGVVLVRKSDGFQENVVIAVER